MIKFSVVIITLNEEKIIGRCIDAVCKISEDIIIIDSNSTDKTTKIAKDKGAKVFLKNWEGYSAAKNYGVQQCANDWIISIDADEILSPKLIKSINALTPTPNTIYQINILGNFLGKWVKHSGWYPSWKKRIYNSTKFHWDNAEVHESLTGEENFKLQKLAGDAYHYSYITIEDVNLKTDRYAKLLAKEMLNKNKTPSLLKRIFGPTYKFVNTFFFKFGFLDGKTGYQISKMNSVVVRKKIKYFDMLKKNLTQKEQ